MLIMWSSFADSNSSEHFIQVQIDNVISISLELIPKLGRFDGLGCWLLTDILTNCDSILNRRSYFIHVFLWISFYIYTLKRSSVLEDPIPFRAVPFSNSANSKFQVLCVVRMQVDNSSIRIAIRVWQLDILFAIRDDFDRLDMGGLIVGFSQRIRSVLAFNNCELIQLSAGWSNPTSKVKQSPPMTESFVVFSRQGMKSLKLNAWLQTANSFSTSPRLFAETRQSFTRRMR